MYMGHPESKFNWPMNKLKNVIQQNMLLCIDVDYKLRFSP